MSEPIFFDTPDAFAEWMEAHSQTETELWVGYFKAATGKTCMTWSQSVDVALCYGWIDGVRYGVDEARYKIRFSPRKPNSVWSKVNVQKVEALLAQGTMKPAGLRLFEARRDKEGYTSEDRNMVLDPVFEDQLKSDTAAWAFFDALAPSYKRETIWWVMSAKRDETRRKRFAVVMQSCQEGQKIPMLRKKS